jgi:hypothetical protein
MAFSAKRNIAVYITAIGNTGSEWMIRIDLIWVAVIVSPMLGINSTIVDALKCRGRAAIKADALVY